MAINLHDKYSKQIQTMYVKESLVVGALSNDYDFTGVKTVNVYSIPTVEMVDYTREGANRYGTPGELGNDVQSLTITKDRAWTFTIDKGNKTQSQMVNHCPLAA